MSLSALAACSLIIRDPTALSIPPAADAATISRADALADLEFLIRDAGKSLLRTPFRWLPLPLLVAEARDYYLGEIGTLSRPRKSGPAAAARRAVFRRPGVRADRAAYVFSGCRICRSRQIVCLATIVGEAPGGQPNSFGNPMPFRLPRSKLTLRIATSRAMRANGDVADFKPVTPDIIVRSTAADIRAGFGPVLERATNCPPRTSK